LTNRVALAELFRARYGGGMATYIIDASPINTPGEFWQKYLDAVKPDGAEYFGRNLAAMHDALMGGPGWPGEDFTLVIENHKSSKLGPQFFAKLPMHSMAPVSG
jgi:ribonuclease inhibitor